MSWWPCSLLRSLRGEPTRPFSYRSRGQLSTIGNQKAVAEILGVHLSGSIAWFLLRGVYLLKLPTFARKVRVFFEWTWTCFFPPDIARLSFSRTRGRQESDREQS